MNSGYFHRVQNETPTRLWVNNPTASEAVEAIKAGAEYCTTNPTYGIKMLNHPEMEQAGRRILQEVLTEERDDSLAASKIQARLADILMKVFLPVYNQSEGTRGWVSIQGDPEKEENPSEILREADENLSLGKNFIAKVPVTSSGLRAIEELSANNIPVIATEVMSLSQAVHACETYVKAVSGKKKPAPIYVTHITGIFDQHLGEWKKNTGADISDEILYYAGILAGREQYRVIKERKYPVTILGGGARGLHHFTEFVGADMHITINWKGTGDQLILQNPPVVNRFFQPLEKKILDELLEKVPVFFQAWDEHGLKEEDFGDFPPVQLFRSMFLEGWNQLKETIRRYRNEG